MTLYVFGFDASDSIDIILAVFSYCCIDKKNEIDQRQF
jgi:hypothetical protein